MVDAAKVSKYAFIALLLILTYFAAKLVQPFFTYIFLGLILTIAVYPLYRWLCQKIKSKRLSSLIVIVLILLIIIIPVSIIISSLVKQTVGFISSWDDTSLEKVNQQLVQAFGPKADLTANIDEILGKLKDFIVNSTLSIAGSVADVSLGLFLMFFVMYYGLIEGEQWGLLIGRVLPFKKDRKEKLIDGVKRVTHAVIYGQIFIALIQGTLGGIGFFMVGIKNPVFWGFIMTVLAFIPVTGTGIVWLPAGIIQIMNNDLFGGIFILVYGVFVVSGIDNLLRPGLLSKSGKIHPVVALIGVLGGLKVFGLLGIIIGPLIAAMFITMAEFFYEDYMRSHKKDNLKKNNIQMEKNMRRK